MLQALGCAILLRSLCLLIISIWTDGCLVDKEETEILDFKMREKVEQCYNIENQSNKTTDFNVEVNKNV